MSASESLMPGPEGKIPRFYEVDRGHKTESYITAVSGNPVQPPPPTNSVQYSKVNDRIEVCPSDPKKNGRVGLTEAELEPYSDSRSWRLLRWFLFAVFCLLWLLMFFVALLLIIFSPGCVIQTKPHWWQTAVAYSVWVPSFQDSDGDGNGDVQGLIDRLENLRKSGVQTIWPSPFLLSDDMGSAVRGFSQLESRIGPNQDADRLIQKTHEKEMRFVFSIPIATTSTEHEWFLASATASLPENKNYSQFYYWAPKSTSDEFFSRHKTLFYLHEKGNPKAAILNWKHEAVRTHMFAVFSEWIDRGVDGFHLDGIEHLARTPNGTAPDWPAINDVIRDIRDHVDTYAAESAALTNQGEKKKIALFATRDEAKEKDKRALASSGLDTVINYELGRVQKDSDICHKNEGSVATCVHEILSDVLLFHSLHADVWPHWEFGGISLSRVASRVGSRSHAELLSMLQLVLPGTNNIYYGEEIGMRDLPNDTRVARQRGAMQWDDGVSAGFSLATGKDNVPVNPDYKNVNWKRQYAEERSPLKMFSKLAKLRQSDDTLMSGSTLVGRLIDGAFTITRFAQENNRTAGLIYVAAMNFSPHPVSLPLIDLPNNAKMVKSQVVTTTSNVNHWHAREIIDLSSKSISLASDQGVVFRYTA